MIFIFEKKSIFVCLFAVILELVNCKILITSPNQSYFLKQLVKLGFKIQDRSLLYLDMSLPNIKDYGVIDGDWNKVSDKCVENLCNNIDVSNDLHLFFPNIKDVQKKIKLFIYEHFYGIFSSQQSIITWLNSSVYKNSIVVNFSALKPGAKSIWRSSNLRVVFIFSYFNFFI